MAGTLVVDLLIVLTAGLVAGLLSRWLRVSILIGYLSVGAVVGKACFGLVDDQSHQLEYIAEAGVFMLLFSIGIEFSLDELWRLGRNLVVGGTAQMLLVAAPVFMVMNNLGMSWQSAALMSAAISFCSTVLVFKTLSEWGHSSLPHGRRAIGVLLFQDAALVPLLLVVPLLTGSGKVASPLELATLGATSFAFVAAVVALRFVLANWIIPLFASYRSPELIVLFTLVCLGEVTLIAYNVGLPPAIGAFAAGLVFSGNRWTKQIDALVLPFRETFAAVFFVCLGMLFDPRLFWHEPLLMFGSLAGLILLKTVAATVALRLTGLSWRDALGMGIGLAHVGEFAFVVVALGTEVGVISEHHFQQVVVLAISSLILSPLLMKTGLRWTRSIDESDGTLFEVFDETEVGRQAIVIGAGPIGRQVTSRLETAGKDVCMIDLSPINLHPFAQLGFRTVAGNANDAEILALAHADKAPLAVVCVPDDETAVSIVENLRGINSDSVILVRCRYQAVEKKLVSAGASRVVSEETQAGVALLRILAELGEDA